MKRVAVASGTGLIFVLTAVAPGAAVEEPMAPAAPTSCSSVLFVGARGSGQTASMAGGFGREVGMVRTVLAAQLPGLPIHNQPVQYASESVDVLKPSTRNYIAMTGGATIPLAIYDYKKTHVDPFMASVQDGADEVALILRSRRGCSSERIVLAGYSQGAMAVHRALQRLAAAGESAILNRVDAVVLIADGDRVPGSASTVVGTPPASRAGTGIAVWAGQQKKDLPARLIPLTIHVCDHADIVCDFSLTNIKAGRSIHTSYADRSQISVAAQKAATQVRIPPGTARWVQDTRLPDGTVVDHGEGRLTVSSTVLRDQQVVTIDYQLDQSDPSKPNASSAIPCRDPGPEMTQARALHIVVNGATAVGEQSPPPRGYLVVASPMTRTLCVIGDRFVTTTRYSGPATFRLPVEAALTNEPIGVYWSQSTSQNGATLTTTYRPVGVTLSTTR